MAHGLHASTPGYGFEHQGQVVLCRSEPAAKDANQRKYDADK